MYLVSSTIPTSVLFERLWPAAAPWKGWGLAGATNEAELSARLPAAAVGGLRMVEAHILKM